MIISMGANCNHRPGVVTSAGYINDEVSLTSQALSGVFVD